MNTTKESIIILAFEGPDKVGKSTLIAEVNRHTNYRFLCIDRFLGSAWVYDRLSGRRNRTDTLVEVERELAKLKTVTVINVILTCELSEMNKRILDQDEYPHERLKVLSEALQLYKEYAQNVTQLSTVWIDTTDKPIADTVNEIVKKVVTVCLH